jgi:YegS/Rv2252/BmrU family lipid kinase
MRDYDRILLIANPTSGWGKARWWAARAATGMREAGGRVELVVTRAAGDGRAAVEHLDGDNNLAVAFGGDGTFNELLNGADLQRCTLAFIPAGAGNVLGKELGMSRRPWRAVEQLVRGRAVAFDVGLCNGRRFISVFGAGIDARAVELVHRGRKGGLTQIHYIPHVLHGVLEAARFGIRASVDGEPFIEGAAQVCAGNTRSYGGPIAMTPAAAPNDGLLDVMGMRLEGPGRLPALLAGTVLRSLHLDRRAEYGRGRRLVVTAERDGVPYELDGEDAGVLPATIELMPGAARLLVPRSFHVIRREPRPRQ